MPTNSIYLKKNIGPLDQVIRIIVGITLVLAPPILNWSPWTIAILATVGGAQILEGLIGY